MRTRFRSRSIAVAAMVALTLVAAACNTASDGKTQVITAAGSDTTQNVMDVVLANFQNNGTDNKNAEDTIKNIPAVPATPYVVPAEPAGSTTGNCEQRTYVAAGSPPATYTAPNGSSSGKTALKDPANLTSTCIDIARSSSGPSSTTDPATFEYYAFAKDAVSWSAYRSAFQVGNAPAALTKQQLKDIYACNITNWNQVGGGNGIIARYLPQVGSGTRAFFLANILDNEVIPNTCAIGGNTLKLIEENKSDQIDRADISNSINPYSVAQYVAQVNHVIPDHTDGGLSTVRSIITNGVAENPVTGPDANGKYAPNATVINGSTFPGSRFVYNVLDSRLPSYTAALRVVGFSANGQSPLCSGGEANTLTQYGFVPLPAVSGVTCIKSVP